ncbi:hypothetical protein CDIK_0473 [Cucumispora dikerogammari]|nr:hypothetical protein CDIK_0473 [Cucumispora dikerogammari]
MKFKKIRGKSYVIEVEETALKKRKFKRRRLVFTLWCVGGVCRTHKEFFFKLASVKDKETPHSILMKHVDINFDVITDEWGGTLVSKIAFVPIKPFATRKTPWAQKKSIHT